eukprot:30294-Pelagococcus_subviridis.AAC.81
MLLRRRTSSRSTGRRLSLLSKTISAYADITACPAPSCRSFCRSSARRLEKMSESTNRMAVDGGTAGGGASARVQISFFGRSGQNDSTTRGGVSRGRARTVEEVRFP